MSKGNKKETANGESTILDVAVVGGGPAGISACVELSKAPKFKIALFESDAELGGIPRASHILFFGFRDLKRICTGRAYARKLEQLIRKTSVEIHTGETVLNIFSGSPGELHQMEVLSSQGVSSYHSRFIILATGCFETSRAARIIPGTRPAGILTTGTLMELVNLYRVTPGKRALIIGSEHVALETILTLRRAGTSIAGLVEQDHEVQTYPVLAKAMSFFFGFPIYKDTSVSTIFGDKRVEGVELVTKTNQSFQVDCDTVIISGKFRAYSPLIDESPIERDPSTFGPVVDMNLMTSVSNIFSAGNILRGAEMHDLCALEGKQAARNILKRIESGEGEAGEFVSIGGEYPVRFVVPQKIIPAKIKSHRFSWLYPGVTLQVAHTLNNPVLEAWSNDGRIWTGSFTRLIGNTRIPLPIHEFDWDRVDRGKGITVKVRGADS